MSLLFLVAGRQQYYLCSRRPVKTPKSRNHKPPSLKPRVPVRALQELQVHLLEGDRDSRHPDRKRSAAIVLLLLRSARERRDGVSLAEARCPSRGSVE